MSFFFKDEAFICYFILAVFALITFSPFYIFQINKLLADLTQNLIIEEINPVRISYGFSQLRPNEKLSQAAQLKAEDMLARNYFSHTGPEGESPWVWLEQVGYQYAAAGENLAIDVNDPAVLKDAWLVSPLHAKNILNSYFTDIGIGIANGKIRERKTIVVVMFLGREITQPEKALAIFQETAKETIKETPPQEPLIVKVIEEEKLEKENLTIATEAEKLSEAVNNKSNSPKTTNFQIFLNWANKFPEILRMFLTVFFSFLIFWLLTRLVLRKQKANFVVPRLVILIIFSLLPWLI